MNTTHHLAQCSTLLCRSPLCRLVASSLLPPSVSRAFHPPSLGQRSERGLCVTGCSSLAVHYQPLIAEMKSIDREVLCH